MIAPPEVQFLDFEQAETLPAAIYMVDVNSPIAHGRELARWTPIHPTIPNYGGWSIFLDGNWWGMPRAALSNLRDWEGMRIMLNHVGQPVPR